MALAPALAAAEQTVGAFWARLAGVGLVLGDAGWVAQGRLRAVACSGLIVGLGLLVGCGSSGSDAQAAAVGFYRAMEGGDSAVACSLLAPQTRHTLEQSEHAECQVALPRVGLPAAGRIGSTERFGLHAVARFDGDTVFLAEYDGGWKVVAAGCTPRHGLPYDCVVEGG